MYPDENNVVYTYLMYDDRYYKIGRSKSPKSRQIELKVANPLIRIICYGVGISEKDAHNLFSHKHVSGEFFDLNEKEVSSLISLINPSTVNSRRKKIIRAIDNHSKFLKYENYIITFGKYCGRKLISMHSLDEINYVKYISGNSYTKSIQEAFNWWACNFDRYIDKCTDKSLNEKILKQYNDKQQIKEQKELDRITRDLDRYDIQEMKNNKVPGWYDTID